VVVDEVYYDGGPGFPDPSGASMHLMPGALDATSNDDGANWCISAEPYGDGDLGTPGAAPVDCYEETTTTTTPSTWTVADLGPGDLVITEILKDSTAVSDDFGEWFEVYNASGHEVDLEGMTIRDDGSDSHVVSGSLVVAAGAYVVFGVDSDTAVNGGVDVDYAWGNDLTLGNGDDEIYLEYGGVVFDAVLYDGGTDWVDPSGASLTLDPASRDADLNDDGANWCEGSSSFGDGDLGTPGADNDAC
jgi:hypothetical protein